MAWTESTGTPGIFKRPLSISEEGMVSAVEAFRPSPRELIRINAFAEFTTRQPAQKVISAFRTAWKALRLLKSPDIATIFEDGYKVYQVPSPSELDAWVERTFIASAAPGTTVQSAVRAMQQRIELLPVCQLIPHPGTSTSTSISLDDTGATGPTFKGTIILFISHWRTEAAGAFKILNHVFSFAADLLLNEETSTTAARLSAYRSGDEWRLLTPAIEDILMPADVTTQQPTTPESKARVAAHFDKYYSSLPSVGFPMSTHNGESTATAAAAAAAAATSAPFGPVKEIRHMYSVPATKAFHASCKSHGISITAAIHSAYIGAVYSAARASSPAPQEGEDASHERKWNRNRKYACLMPAQVRTRLPRSSPYRDQGCWSSAQMLMIVVPSGQEQGQDFLNRARDLRGQYTLADKKEWMYADARETSEQVSMLGSRTPPPGQPVSMAYFTGLGVLDGEMITSEYGHERGEDEDVGTGGEGVDEKSESPQIRISDLDFFADPLAPGIVLRVWTFQSRLNIHVVWNGAYHDDEQIRDVMRSIDETLTKDLGVDMLTERVAVEEKEF
ncbi:hypothetical protein RBB50_004734 [Rhinocladiella similis]